MTAVRLRLDEEINDPVLQIAPILALIPGEGLEVQLISLG